MAAFSNWLELPDHLQALFMNKLIFIKDYIHFGAVCRPWRSLLDQYIDLEKLPRPQLPLLMIPSSSSSSSYPSSIDKKKDNERDDKWSFYSLTQRRVYDLGIKLPYNQHCRGSSHGWLVTVEEDTDFSVRLFNPFLQDSNEIKLPPLKSFELNPHVDEEVYDYLFLKKAILSKDPTSSNTKDDDDDDDDEDLLVIVIYGEVNRLAIYKPGDESWTALTYEWFGIGTTENYTGMLHNFSDVAYSKGMVYVVQWRGTVVSFDMHAIIAAHASHQHPNPKVFKTVATSRPLNDYGGKMKYIVESSGDLLQVQRFYRGDETTKEFRVFKLLFDPTTEEEEEKQNQESKSKWIEVKTLQGRILFLGDNDSISLSPLDCPGCKPNCIYFTDDDFERYWLEEFPSVGDDLGVFNLEDGSVEQHYLINSNASIFPPPIWVHPTMTVLLNDIYRRC